MQSSRSSIAVILFGLSSIGCAANPAALLPSGPADLALSPAQQSASQLEQLVETAGQLIDERVAAPTEAPSIKHLSPEAPPVPVTAVDPQQVTPACPPAGTRVLLIGDSLSAGLARPMAELAAECGTPFHHRGVVGSHATQWVTDGWLLPQLERAKPTHVLLSMGGNDFMRNDPEKVQRAVDQLVAKIRERDIELLWISPPTMPFEDKAGVRQMWQQALGGQPGADWFAAERLTIARSSDRIHPTPREYGNLSSSLWKWMSGRTSSAGAV